MRRSVQWRVFAMAGILASATWTSCSGGVTAESSAVAPPAAIPFTSRDVWVLHPEAHGMVAVWLGPVVRVDVEGAKLFRSVNVVFHHDDPRNPQGVVSRPVLPDSRQPVTVEDVDVRIDVRPVSGRTWRDVTSRNDLVVLVDGL